MKTIETFKTDLTTLRTDLNATTYRVEKVQELLSDLVEKLDGLYDQSVSNKDQAVDLVRAADDLKPAKDTRALCSSHYRMLAILNEYGVMHREHIARILGVKPKTIGQYAHIVKHHGLAHLQTRRGVVSLQSLADGVSDNTNFKI
jgi:DNA-directed RNA polymerase specialized sigma24 family protein